jgi:D-arabinose 1-dehydrogenase-like Zn-dependent alcohol dehydrogenase
VKAITVGPRKRETAHLEEVPEPDGPGGPVLVEAIAVGVCETDIEILEGDHRHGVHPPHPGRGRVLSSGNGWGPAGRRLA